jgi:hypothetical protein
MLTYAELAYADVCWHILTCADVCCVYTGQKITWEHQAQNADVYVSWRILTYAGVC